MRTAVGPSCSTGVGCSMDMVDNKRPFKLELKQRYITFTDMDHYWDSPDGGNKKKCDVSNTPHAARRGLSSPLVYRRRFYPPA